MAFDTGSYEDPQGPGMSGVRKRWSSCCNSTLSPSGIGVEMGIDENFVGAGNFSQSSNPDIDLPVSDSLPEVGPGDDWEFLEASGNSFDIHSELGTSIAPVDQQPDDCFTFVGAEVVPSEGRPSKVPRVVTWQTPCLV